MLWTLCHHCGHCVTSFPNDYQSVMYCTYVYVCTCTEVKIVFAWLCVPWGCASACSISAISSCCLVLYYRALRECAACRSLISVSCYYGCVHVNTWGLKYKIYHLLHVYMCILINTYCVSCLTFSFSFLCVTSTYFLCFLCNSPLSVSPSNRLVVSYCSSYCFSRWNP